MTDEMMKSFLRHLRLAWNEWNIRGVILLSLSFQTLLILVSPFRKATKKTFPILLVWCSYLMADWAANFCLGLISDSQRDSTHPKVRRQADLLAFWAPFLLLHLGGPDTITALALEDNELWLRHLLALVSQAAGSIYVFGQSFPDNILWIPTVMMFVAGVIKYVERTRALFLASLDHFRDSMLKEPDPGPNYAKMMEEYACKKEAKLPTNIIYIPEPDKENKLSTQLLKLNDVQVVLKAYKYFNIFKGLVVDLIFSFRERNESRDFFRRLDAETALRVIEVELNFIYEVMYTKVQVVQTKIGYSFRVLSSGAVMASLGYFYYKVPKSEFNGFRFDVGVTYALLLGAIALDFIALLMLVFSDWTLTKLDVGDDEGTEEVKDDQGATSKPENKDDQGATSTPSKEDSRWKKIMSRLASFYSLVYLKMRRPWWRESRCQENGHVHYVLSTPILFRRWSGCVSGHNLIRFCLKGRPTPIHGFTGWTGVLIEKSGVGFFFNFLNQVYSKTFGKVLQFVEEEVPDLLKHVSEPIVQYWERIGLTVRRWLAEHWGTPWLLVLKDKFVKIVVYILHLPSNLVELLGLRNTLDAFFYLSSDRITKELWTFIFHELKQKSDYADDPETAKRISAARGDWVLTDTDMKIDENRRKELMRYVTDVKYDESLLLWHIATELCYNHDTSTEMDPFKKKNKRKPPTDKEILDKFKQHYCDYREISKMLSDYMMYLLVMQPTMMSAVAGIGKIRFRDTCAEAERFFVRRRLKPKDQKKACNYILEVNTEVKPVHVKGDRSKSVLFDACILAKFLNEHYKDRSEKWRLLSRIWVEMMSYAAAHCRASTHARELSKGGELISFVWLLMAHFGLGEQFQINEGHARAKLVVGK